MGVAQGLWYSIPPHPKPTPAKICGNIVTQTRNSLTELACGDTGQHPLLPQGWHWPPCPGPSSACSSHRRVPSLARCPQWITECQPDPGYLRCPRHRQLCAIPCHSVSVLPPTCHHSTWGGVKPSGLDSGPCGPLPSSPFPSCLLPPKSSTTGPSTCPHSSPRKIAGALLGSVQFWGPRLLTCVTPGANLHAKNVFRGQGHIFQGVTKH